MGGGEWCGGWLVGVVLWGCGRRLLSWWRARGTLRSRKAEKSRKSQETGKARKHLGTRKGVLTTQPSGGLACVQSCNVGQAIVSLVSSVCRLAESAVAEGHRAILGRGRGAGPSQGGLLHQEDSVEVPGRLHILVVRWSWRVREVQGLSRSSGRLPTNIRPLPVDSGFTLPGVDRACRARRSS